MLPLFGCREGNLKIIEPPPGKRDYLWTVDTLAYPGSFQTSMYSIWASSAKNVYVVGHNDQNRGQMFHYDGSSWQPVHLSLAEGGNVAGSIDLTSISGTGPSDIYAAGSLLYANSHPPPNILDSSLIIHFDGTSWQETPLPVRTRQFLGIVESRTGEVFAGGIAGEIYHLKEGIWDITYMDPSVWFFRFTASSMSERVYALAYQLDDLQPLDSIYYHMFTYSNRSWGRTITSLESLGAPSPTMGDYALWVEPSRDELYSCGNGVYKYAGDSSWTRLLGSSYGLNDIYGSSPNNLFAVGELRTVYHWNGANWKLMTELQQFSFIDWFVSSWTDGNEVFILGASGAAQTYIVHGR